MSTTFNNITGTGYPAEECIPEYCTGLYRMSDGWFIAFYDDGSNNIKAYVSEDGVTWTYYPSIPSWEYGLSQWHVNQSGDDLYIATVSNASGSGSYKYAKMAYNGGGSWTVTYINGGGSYYYGYYMASGLCNKTGYPFVATFNHWNWNDCQLHFINEAFDTIATETFIISAISAPKSKALFSVGSEVRMIQVYTDGSGYKARYWTTSGYSLAGQPSGGTVFCENPLTDTHSLAVFQEDADSDAYILLATATGLYAYDHNLANARLITSMTVTDVKIGKMGSSLYCTFRNANSPYGFYQCINYGGTLWGTPIYIDDTADANYVHPQICHSTPGSTLYLMFQDNTPTYSNLIMASLVPWAPPWVTRAGEYIEPPCGYFGQVISGTVDISHLEGQVVSIYANGDVLDQQVVHGGTVNISSEYSLVHVGLPYYSDLETLNIEVPMKEGTMQSKREKINNVTFSFKDSRGGYIGPDEDHLWEAFTIDAVRQSTGRNYGDTDLVTDDVRQPLGGQYGPEGSVFFRQVDPLPVTIGAIIPEVSVGGISR